MMNFLLVLSIIGILTSTMYALLVTVGALRLARRRRVLPARSVRSASELAQAAARLGTGPRSSSAKLL